MGIVKPSWIDQDFFKATPFNFCDHFGNKKRLAEICLICEEEYKRDEKYKRDGKDPNTWTEVFADIGENLAKTMKMVHEEAYRMGIDLNNLEDVPEPPPANKYTIYQIVSKYGKKVEKVINGIAEVPLDADFDLIEKALSVFSHSRYYVIVKTARALSSRWHEKKDNFDEAYDSKTSALFAYMASERNSRAALALSTHKPLRDLKIKHLKFAEQSLFIAELIRRTFFPKDILDFKEFGCEEYDLAFQRIKYPDVPT